MSLSFWSGKENHVGYIFWSRLCLGLICASLAFLTDSGSVTAQDRKAYQLVTGDVASQTYAIGIGISSLVKIEVMPETGIDLEAVPTSGFLESFVLLNQGDADFALLRGDWNQLISGAADATEKGAFASTIQTVATLSDDDRQSTLLIARSDVDQNAVYEVTKAIFEHHGFLQRVEGAAVGITLDNALADINLPLHEGARQYYQEKDALPPALASADDEPTDLFQEARTFTIYFDLGQASISEDGVAVLDDLEAFARSLKSPLIWIAGYTDTTGDADYNLDLAQRRADAVMADLQSRQIDSQGIEVTALGERSPWIVTSDQVDEARNRRVEILVEPVVDRFARVQAEDLASDGEDKQADHRRPTF
ncbi:MAG: phosphate ABC transporter substrate-binding/OmpA family protein [Pseudomonadota bacterium]